MCCKNYWKKIVSFGLAFLLGFLIVSVSRTIISYYKAQELIDKKNKVVKIQDRSDFRNVDSENQTNKPLRVITKPRPVYTLQARENNTQGTITLRVTFLANGNIGSVSPVNQLPDGLTEQAISAAKQITFEPATRNGQPMTVVKSVQFSFTIY